MTRTTVSYGEFVEACDTNSTLEYDNDGPNGHALTIEHYGASPMREHGGNYLDDIRAVLGNPETFGDWHISIEPHHTVVYRDVPVSELISRKTATRAQESGTLTERERELFDTVTEDMTRTVMNVAATVEASVQWVRETLLSHTQSPPA